MYLQLHGGLRGISWCNSIPRGQLPATPGRPVRQDYEYARHGRCNLFVVVEPLTGFRCVWTTARRTKLDCAEVLRWLVDDLYPAAKQIVLVTDNLNIHQPACLYARFSPQEAQRIAAKLEWHYTPEHGSWLNIAECELSILQRQCLNRPLPDLATVACMVETWEEQRNQQTSPINWRFTTQDARIKLRHLYPTEISNSEVN